jgi:hypothetical protein
MLRPRGVFSSNLATEHLFFSTWKIIIESVLDAPRRIQKPHFICSVWFYHKWTGLPDVLPADFPTKPLREIWDVQDSRTSGTAWLLQTPLFTDIYIWLCVYNICPKVPKTFKKTTVNVTPFRILDFEGFQIWTMCGHKQWSLEPQAHHCQPWIAKGVGILCVHCHHLQRRNRSFTENRSSKRDGQLGWSRTPTLGFGHDWKMNALFARKTAGN